MGSVYLGYQQAQQRQVAVKVLPDHLAANEDYVKRFHREAKSVAKLDHPNIVHHIDDGQDKASGKHYLVLEYVDGPSAHALLNRFGRLPVGDAVHIILDVARALEHAHSRRIVHRDIKPDNILLSQSGVAKLADLGLAKKLDDENQLTAARQGFGTPFYMPYEQSINAKQADGRSDIYALGATLYHLLTGEVPFPGQNALEIAERKSLGRFKPASAMNPAVPALLDRILSRMMACKPADRYQTASDLIVDLERSNLSSPVPSFVDPDLALQDPLVRARLTTQAQPTKLDPALANRQRAAESHPDTWYLRYRTADGQWRKARLTTEQIRKRLAEGRIGPKVEASPLPHGEYRLLKTYPEFQVPAAAASGPKHAPEKSNLAPGLHRGPQVSSLLRQARWLVPVCVLLLTAITVLAYFFFAG